ncbi:MAG: translation initiation factor [Planctomycetota bacterium]
MAGKVVWSSGNENLCSVCGSLTTDCRCQVASPEGPARIRIEKRRGKTVTVVAEIPLEISDVKRLLRDLKKRCATGGTSKKHTIELQGDHVESVRTWLGQCSIAYKGWN